MQYASNAENETFSEVSCDEYKASSLVFSLDANVIVTVTPGNPPAYNKYVEQLNIPCFRIYSTTLKSSIAKAVFAVFFPKKKFVAPVITF